MLFPDSLGINSPLGIPNLYDDRCLLWLFLIGLTSVPRDIPEDTLMIDLQNNDITDIKEDDFKKLSNLYVREMTIFRIFTRLLLLMVA